MTQVASKKRIFGHLLPVILFLIFSIGSLISYHYVNSNVANKARIKFHNDANEMTYRIKQNIAICINALYGAQGFFAASKSVERDEWRAYIRALKLKERFSGVTTMRYAEVVKEEDRQAFVESVRQDTSIIPEGYPNFEIRSGGSQPQREYYAVKYVEPSDGNEEMLGFDLASDPKRHKILQRARDQGEPEFSGKLVFRHGINKGKDGFLIVLPIFKNGMPISTQEERAQALVGYVEMAIQSYEMLANFRNHSTLAMEIFDSDAQTLVQDEEALLYRNFDVDNLLSKRNKALIDERTMIQNGSRLWTIHFYGFPSYGLSKLEKAIPLIVALFTLMAGLLFSAILFFIMKSQKMALSLAHQMTQDLQESERRIREVLENVTMVAMSLNAQGDIVFANDFLLQLTGWQRSEVLGRNWFDLFVPRNLVIRNIFYDTIKTGNIPAHYTNQILTRDGKPRLISWNNIVLKNREGEVIGTTSIGEDITEQKKSEEILRESEAKLKQVTHAVPGMVYQYRLAVDGEQSFLFVSHACKDIFGVEADKVLKDFNAIWSEVLPEDVDGLVASIEKTAKTLLPWFHEFRIRTPSGQLKWIRGNSIPQTPIRSDGSILWDGILLDVTEQKKLENQLLQSQKMDTVGTLAGGIAHDLNNQLTPLMGYIDLLLYKENLNPDVRQLLTEANVSAKRSAEVVQRLLDFSRPSTQQKRALEAEKILEEIKKLLRTVMPANIEVSVILEEKNLFFLGNETEIQTVLMNLATNARDAMAAQGGKFFLQARKVQLDKSRIKEGFENGVYVEIIARDTGTGMPPEVIRKIYEPFFTTKEKGKGTGLGLAMVFNIIKDHGGWIEVSSEVGRGTEFRLLLPLLAAKEQIKCTETSATLPTGNETILFADDEEPVRNMGKLFLERLGYSVFLACNGDEAVKLYRENRNRIAAVVMDMTMPGMTGKNAIQNILMINPKAKVIAASGFTEEGSAPEIIQAGALDFLQKPYTILPLSQKLRHVLDAA